VEKTALLPPAYGDTGARWRCMTKSGESERCVALDWSAGWFPYRPARPVFESWHGSMIEGKRDASGLLYRRNRYYDPGSGRFTQEDPIGLAGGLNLYGYAEGDPVNYSDPYGLCAVKGAAASVAMGRTIAAATGSEYGFGSLAFDVVGGALCAGVLVRGVQMLRGGARVAGNLRSFTRGNFRHDLE
jgi:RHS repeat-associated protein